MARKKAAVNRGETNGFEFLVRNEGDEELKKSLGLDWENLTCWFCGRRGHIMRQCTVPKPRRITGEQKAAVMAGKAFVSDDGEFIPTDKGAGSTEQRHYRFQVKMIMGDNKAYVVDNKLNTCKVLPLFPDQCPITEENFTETFKLIAEGVFKAVAQMGTALPDGEIVCTTFNAGTIVIFPQGRA